MKTILITGSNGLTGQKIIYDLRGRKDVRCIATSKGENRTKAKDGYEYESLDITNADEVDHLFSKYKPDALINTAAMTNVDACEIHKDDCRKMNVDAVAYLIAACRKHNTHFIHLSTDFVFDGMKGSPYAETDKPNPESFYAASKYDGELLLQKSDMKWAILRTIIIYGVVDDNKRSNLVLWTKNSLEKKQTINVITDQFRAPTLAEDLAHACVQAALNGATGIYHVAGDETKSILDWVEITADFFHLDKSTINPVTTASLNQPAKRPPYTGFIIDKAKRDLGFTPHTFLEGLQIIKEQLQKLE
ncbi:dTDP-4-dehydrorhamnose reductase [soil metagenome]